jgi:transposase
MRDITDQQWALVEPFLREKRRPDGRGRPFREARQVLNGVLWILRTGAAWQDLPPRYGPYQTCHRRFQQWVGDGRLEGVLWALAEDLLARGQLDLEESFIDASFVGAKKGALQLVQRSTAKGARSWQSQTAMVFLSPYGLRALRRMSANWSRRRSSNGSLRPYRRV